jgi:hydroxymethylpyrimidine/phosphomethylpyrimidine kinase
MQTKSNSNIKRVLIIAGSDSGGGAGIQGDIKTACAHGVFATTAITALTSQNTQGVTGIFDVSPTFVSEQIEVVLEDIGTDAIKIGMLNTSGIITAITKTLKKPQNLVLDTVMIAKGGAALLKDSAITALKTKLIPLAKIVTPNIPEAELLTGIKITKMDDMLAAGKKILEMGAEYALVKGGHIKGNTIYDVVVSAKKFEVFTSEKIQTNNTHGTGCAMATAIACNLAKGDDVMKAVERARDFVRQAILTAPKIGSGHGPLNLLLKA